MKSLVLGKFAEGLNNQVKTTEGDSDDWSRQAIFL